MSKNERINNWGKWGKEDELGALNYINREKIIETLKIVKKGEIYSLAIPIRRTNVPVYPGRNPCLHLMSIDGGDYAAGARPPGGVQAMDDYIFMATHGSTHIDALAHVSFENQLYNGFSMNDVRSSGARKCGIENIKGIFTRGVMLDLPKFKKVDHLEGGYIITADDLESCSAYQKVGISSGDILLIRTGWLNVFSEDPSKFQASSPGIGLESAKWIIKKNIVAVGSDNLALEVFPWEQNSVVPVHVELIRNNGVYLMEYVNLEELSRDGVHEFLFVAAPLKIMGGVGSPLNPLAVV